MSTTYRRRSPQSGAAIFQALKTAGVTNSEIILPEENPLTAAHKTKIDLNVPTSFASRFIKEYREIDIALGQQGPLTEELNRLADRLRKFDSYFLQVVDFAIDLQVFPSGTGARAFYGRDLTGGPLPDLITYDNLETVADTIVAGEAARLVSEGPGAVPMPFPTASQVGSARDEFHDARLLSQAAIRRTDKEREDLQALYDEGLALVLDIWDTVEFFYRHDPDPSSFRAKCARWGVVYVFEQTEPPTPPNP